MRSAALDTVRYICSYLACTKLIAHGEVPTTDWLGTFQLMAELRMRPGNVLRVNSTLLALSPCCRFVYRRLSCTNCIEVSQSTMEA